MNYITCQLHEGMTRPPCPEACERVQEGVVHYGPAVSLGPPVVAQGVGLAQLVLTSEQHNREVLYALVVVVREQTCRERRRRPVSAEETDCLPGYLSVSMSV